MTLGILDVDAEGAGRAVNACRECRDRVEHANPEVVDDVRDRDRARVLEEPVQRFVDRAQQSAHSGHEVLLDEETPEGALGVIGRGGEEVELEHARLVRLPPNAVGDETLGLPVLVVVAHDAGGASGLALGVDETEHAIEQARPAIDLAGSTGDGAARERRCDLTERCGVDELQAARGIRPDPSCATPVDMTVAACAAGA